MFAVEAMHVLHSCINSFIHSYVHSFIYTVIHSYKGGTRPFPMGAEFSDEGGKIQLSGYCKCQKSPQKIIFDLPTGG